MKKLLLLLTVLLSVCTSTFAAKDRDYFSDAGYTYIITSEKDKEVSLVEIPKSITNLRVPAKAVNPEKGRHTLLQELVSVPTIKR